MPRLPLLLSALVAFLIAPAASARTWALTGDGSGDAATLAAALDSAAAGDEILLAPGRYPAHDLEWKDGVSLRGATGHAADTIVDAEGAGRHARGIGLGEATTFEAVTFTGGRKEGVCDSDSGTGTYCMGGAWLLLQSAPTFSRCVFAANHADDNGGAVASAVSAPTFRECRFEGNDATHGAAITFVASALDSRRPLLDTCVFTGNVALSDAGAVYAYVSEPELTHCTFHANRCGQQGAAVFWYSFAPPVVDHCIFAFGLGGEAMFSGVPGTAPTLVCCDVWGNEGGDWVGCLAGQEVASGNLAADPLFCDPGRADVDLRAGSPCAPGSPCGAVGAAGVVCAATPVAAFETRSWGRLKATYRGGH